MIKCYDKNLNKMQISGNNLAESIWYCCLYPDCGNHYLTKFNLKQHIENFHLKIKKFQCRICSKFLISKQNLNEHMNIHTRSYPFVCKSCGKAFRQASQLSLHKRSHIGTQESETHRPKNFKRSKSEDFPCVKNVGKLEPIKIDLPKITARNESECKLPSLYSLKKIQNPYIIIKH